MARRSLAVRGGRGAARLCLINACNALSMFNVIELGIPGTHAGLNKVTCFYLRRLANDPTRTVWLNEILDFYTEDFVPVPADDLIDDADRYAPRRIPID